ncbi:unnamed protein product [Rotaria sp. Silwood2]|nr:unnamed protein product [Rotaria sp. Silwood2]CAF2789514.1 unnamed protein product [Rotaria sp. Silwood2]CAF2942524.1 unnamed protein product [Rotaria sp. Silwood2]CAF4311392.1 unnamed protein product [Rotaria sp. Silwood2]CAF4393992.1 unnamed protein product [Rotaria sp. Silwood2]
MSKLVLSYLFKTNLAEFRSAILDDNTDRICRILDIERDCLNKQIDSDGNTALLLAIKYATPLTIRLLLEQGARPDESNLITFQTPLALVASKVYQDYHSHNAKRKLEMAEILLEYGAYVDKPAPHHYKDEDGQEYSVKETPLMTAVRQGNLPLAKLLIKKKANVHYIQRHSGMRAIHYAITNGNEAMFDLLENVGAVCNPLVTNGGNTLLHWFCYKKENDEHTSLLNKLIEKSCNINAKNSNGRTPLMLAVKCNMTNTCRILLKNEVDIEEFDCNGNKAIDLSIPGSACSSLLLQKANHQKSKSNIQNSQSIESKSKIVYKRQLSNGRRSAVEFSDINSDETKDQSAPPKSPNGGGKKIPPPHPHVCHVQRLNSAEIDVKHEHIWGKLLQKRHKRQDPSKLSRQQTYPIDVKYKL